MNWKWRIRHARGYRELGLFKEARHELTQVPPSHAEKTEVLAEFAAVSQELGEWRTLSTACQTLARRHPEDAGWWIMWAYGTRRADSLTAAEKVLLEAEAVHGANPTIQFNLGCYACQLGNLVAAQERVKRAIELDRHFASLAQNDADLEPLRNAAAGPWA